MTATAGGRFVEALIKSIGESLCWQLNAGRPAREASSN
jgi:hypothetical protein